MQRFSSLFLILAAIFTGLLSISCVKAQQDDGEGQTVTSMEAVIAECDLVRDVCSGVNSGNANQKGKLINRGLVSIATVVGEIAFGLQASGPGVFAKPKLVLRAGRKFSASMKALLDQLTQKRDALASFKSAITKNVRDLQSEVNNMIEGLYMHLDYADEAELEKIMSCLDDAFQKCIASFSHNNITTCSS